MGTAAVFILIALTMGPTEARPIEPCNDKVRGQIRPAEASLSPAVMRQSIQCGQLYLCELGSWRHQWRQVAVPYWQLTGKPRPLECALPLNRYTVWQ